MDFPIYPGIAFNKCDKDRMELDVNNKGQWVFRLQKKGCKHLHGFQPGANRIVYKTNIEMDDNGYEYDSNIPSEIYVKFHISQSHDGYELSHSLGSNEIEAANHEARQEAMYEGL